MSIYRWPIACTIYLPNSIGDRAFKTALAF